MRALTLAGLAFAIGSFESIAQAQSLPEQAGPSLSTNSPIPAEQAITNPGGFGSANDKASVDPATNEVPDQRDCHKAKDLRTDGPAHDSHIDCVK